MIERIGERSRECEFNSFGDAEGLGNGGVLHIVSGTFEKINARVAVASGRRHGKAGRIEPAIHGAPVRGQDAAANSIRTAAHGVRVRWIGAAETRREPMTGLQIPDPVDLPSPK